MQGNIAQSLALVAVGNAALAGRDVAGFWPGASVFTFSKLCEFLVPDGAGDWRRVARDPMAWFEMLRRDCVGLRLHTAPMEQKAGLGPIAERILVGFVGGGPRWLIETEGVDRSQLWQGFDRVLDRNDPERRIWAHGYLLQGETDPQWFSGESMEAVIAQLDAALIDIEALSRELETPQFTQCFVQAREALASDAAPVFYQDVADCAVLDGQARGLFAAASYAWVFGGMGSWNDIGGFAPELNARYESCSENLFEALQHAVAAVANSTYRRS